MPERWIDSRTRQKKGRGHAAGLFASGQEEPISPEMQTAIDENKKNLANPKPAPTMNAAAGGDDGFACEFQKSIPPMARFSPATIPRSCDTRGYQIPGLK